MAEIVPAPMEETKTAVSQRGSIGQQAATAGAAASDAGASSAAGLAQAHVDFVQWFYQPHGAIFDGQMANLDAIGVKREVVGYGAVGLAVLLLFTRMAPLVGNAICIAYPVLATLAILRGRSQDTQRLLAYWIVFGVLSIGDYKFGLFATYWLLKVAVCTFLWLPQTQGALLAYGLVIEPAANFIDSNVVKKMQ